MTNQSNNSNQNDQNNNQGGNNSNQGGSNNSNNQGGHNQSGSNNNSNGDTSNRGFASMDSDKQREIASEGGKAAHEKGTAHEFDSEEAREAGKQSHKNDNNNS